MDDDFRPRSKNHQRVDWELAQQGEQQSLRELVAGPWATDSWNVIRRRVEELLGIEISTQAIQLWFADDAKVIIARRRARGHPREVKT